MLMFFARNLESAPSVVHSFSPLFRIEFKTTVSGVQIRIDKPEISSRISREVFFRFKIEYLFAAC